MDGGFAGLSLSDETLQTLEKIGYEKPSKIQAEFIPVAMTGVDCMGQARTGTGKTAAFVLPMLEKLDPSKKFVQAIVLAPTRELSEQVAGETQKLAGGSELRVVSVVGGRPIRQQISALERGSQIVVGTPGRVLDFMRKIKNNIAVIHGDLPQRKRDRVIKDLRSGKIRMLIATDVVGRGIDISGISHIINYDIPEYCDDYVHRVGRTGRMSSDVNGRAITFVTREQGGQLTSIEIRINTLLPEYEIAEFEAARPGPERKTIADSAPVYGSTEIDYSDDEEDDFGSGV
ncbi:UNVERIFIED_CONTAM: hypothetical protein GTU68_052635 [Idotea baltica]|nr:hypothetical protein [Idotea baltica]